MTDGPQNRRSFRISESIYLRYQLIDEEAFSGGIERHRISSGNFAGLRSRLVDIDARIDESLFLLKSQSGKLAALVELLNDKLDIVADQLPAFRETRSSLARQAPQTCRMSADGMVFGADEAIPVDSKLLLHLLLEADSRYIETFARVVRHTDAPDLSRIDTQVGIAVEFVGMKSTEKEVLIQHLFSRESETLRMRRLKLDEME